MVLDNNEIQRIVTETFGTEVSGFEVTHGMLTFTVSAGACKRLVEFMHGDKVLRFNFLTDLCGMHYPDNTPDRQFGMVYLLHNWFDNVRVRIKTFLPAENPETDSLTSVFAAANWMEREAYDFFGIRFAGHPNLKRIMNDDGMTVFPMRKEYPLEDHYRTDKDDRFFGREVNPGNVGKEG